MKSLRHVRTRRQLFRAMGVGAASIPLLALAAKSASAQWRPTARPCFLKGTKISTTSGNRLVEELQIGDEVQTLSGRKTIKWIGYNRFTKEEHRAWQDTVKPIRLGRFAIDDHTPNRDLYLSPLHCVFLNEALIPVMYLVNEATIGHAFRHVCD